METPAKYQTARRTHKTELALIRKAIGRLGGYVYTTHQGPGPGRGRRKGLWGSKGIPDLFCMMWGRSFFVEVKVGRDSLRPEQREFVDVGKAHGVKVVVGDCDAVLHAIQNWFPGRIHVALG